jgi:UMF1 family MFS transporter
MGVPAQTPLTRKREQRAWFVYDWANSAYTTTVVTLFLGPYLTAIAKAAAGPDGLIHPFGIPIDPRSLWGYLVSLSVLSQVLVLPLIGALADYGHRKREILATVAYVGSLATLCLVFVKGANYLLGSALFLIANLAFGASIVVYNAFLPEIASPEERDTVSSHGWGAGYLGGGLMLALNLVFLSNAEALGLSKGMAVRIGMGAAGLWWGLFTLIPVGTLQNRGAQRSLPPGVSIFAAGFRQFSHTLGRIRRYPHTLLFLAAYLVYNDAIQTVIAMAGQFGADELKMPMEQLTLAILMVQFVAFAGAMLFNWISARTSTKRAILGSLIVWTGVLAYIYLAVSTPAEFFVMAALVAVVMGGSQALSRSLFSLMIPPGQEAEYFSLYEISDKGTSWLGPLVFGLALQTTGSYRLAILSLVVFFIVGFILLIRVDVAKAAAEAHAEEP